MDPYCWHKMDRGRERLHSWSGLLRARDSTSQPRLEITVTLILEKWTDTSLKLGITYNINDSSMVYGMFSQGFHSGGFFGVNQNIRDFIRDVYDPETADNYEIGYKSQHLDDRLRFNAVYFYNDFKDKQESFVAQTLTQEPSQQF